MKSRYNTFSATTPVAIPIIQRDYVQGSDANARRRDKFLKAILNALLKPDEDFEIDFIYGSKSHEFVPVDGQQRLTTLMLLGWLLNQRSGRKYTSLLPRLTYHTRPSTEQFVARLLSYDLPDDAGKISLHFTTTPGWFSRRWMEDASVMAMLEFLDKADSILALEKYRNRIDQLAANYFNSNPVTFEFLDMKAMNLSDDLYIKMNARGKALTPFENWKARFQQQLKKRFPEVRYEYGEIPDLEERPTLHGYFVYAVEHSWTDMLWRIALSRWNSLSGEQKREQSYPRTDDLFMSIFNYVSRMLYFTSLSGGAELVKGKDITLRQLYELEEEEILDRLYSDEGNVITLFRILDFFVAINRLPEKSAGFFGGIFTNEYTPATRSTRVNLYKDNTPDLFERCINNNLDTFSEMLLWAVLRRQLDYSSVTVDYARIVTAMLRGRRQRLVNGLSVRPDINQSDYFAINQAVTQLLADADVHQSLAASTDNYLQHERDNEKMYGAPAYDAIVALSGHPDLYYCFDILRDSLAEIKTAADASRYVERFISLMKMDNAARIRLLNRYGYRGIKTATSLYFYGAPSKWDFIFTSGSLMTAKAFTAWMNGGEEKTFSSSQRGYYIQRYEPFIKAVFSPSNNPPHYYFIHGEGSIFTAWAVKSYSSRPIMGYNTCPFAFTVFKEYKGGRLGLWPESYYSDHGVLYVNNPGTNETNIIMECIPTGWKISVDDSRRKVSRKFLKRYEAPDGFADSDGEFSFSGHVLLDLPGEDRISTALRFLATIEV